MLAYCFRRHMAYCAPFGKLWLSYHTVFVCFFFAACDILFVSSHLSGKFPKGVSVIFVNVVSYHTVFVQRTCLFFSHSIPFP